LPAQRRPNAGGALLAVVLCAAALRAPSSGAGIIRHDRDPQLYRDLAAQAQFDPVGKLLYSDGGSERFRCSATLITPDWVLTAAHCVDAAIQSTTPLTGFEIAGQRYDVVETIHHPSWTTNLATGFDIGLVRLKSSVAAVVPAQLYRGDDELGLVAYAAGFGLMGNGVTGPQIGTAGTKLAGTNVIDAIGYPQVGIPENTLLTDFDNPNGNRSTFGDPLPLDLEYSTAPGDSGGPLFVFDGQWSVAGVHSWIGNSDEGLAGFYGGLNGETRVSSHLGWIDSVIPEPSAAALFATAALVAAVRLRRAG
jgi:V8-like Glu-specific endopeptidase